MATRTTNYGLYKPEPTDPFEDFRAEHNANMEIIDQNLGGGGGGGGSVVTWNQIITSGIKIAEISINGTSTDVFSPAGGSGGSFMLMITADTGLTVTATKDGTTLTATETSTGVYEVEVTSAGTWTLSDGTNTATVDVGIYTATLSSVPEGSTVLPTDDIQIWLNCANIWDKTYTTLAEVLADTTTLLALINSNNAVDYMVRSTTWAVSTSVPVMTSNTTPSGVCSSSSIYNTGFEAYKAFDGDDTTRTAFSGNDTDRYIQYDFGTSVVVDHVGIKPLMTTGSTVKTFKVSSSVDGVTFADIATLTHDNTDNYSTYDIPQTVGRYFRVNIVDNYATAPTYYNVCTLQFYSTSVTDNATAMSYIGLNNYCANTLLADSTWCNAICNSEYIDSVLNVKVPAMTSYTTPSGVVSQSSENSGNKGWYAFDNDLTKAWYANGRINGWLQYKFDTAKNIKCLRIAPGYGASNNRMCPRTALVMYSDDGNTFTNENTYSISEPIDASDKTWQVFPLSNGNLTKQYWRAFFAESYGSSASAIMVWELQFYGREDI